MSVSGFMAFSHNDDDDAAVKVSKVKQKSFWSGVLQGLSGPAMLSDQPQVIGNLVEVRDNRVYLKLPGWRRRYAMGSHQEALELARALAQATTKVSDQQGLKIGTETIRRLDHLGKLREVRRPRVQRRAENGSE
ncbi:hypothetical protein ACLBYG_24755 [Methylobacterium sp. D53M]